MSDASAEQLYEQIVGWVRSCPEAFRDIGEEFDHGEHGYSDASMRQRLTKAKRAFYARGRAARVASTEHRTRAFLRKHNRVGERGSRPWLKPRSKAERFTDAWHDTLGRLQQCALNHRVKADREALAGQVVLMTWLLVDPDADSLQTHITEFQHWAWNALGGTSPRRVTAWSQDACNDAASADAVGRRHLRDRLLDRNRDRWLTHLQTAVKVMAASLAELTTKPMVLENAVTEQPAHSTTRRRDNYYLAIGEQPPHAVIYALDSMEEAEAICEGFAAKASLPPLTVLTATQMKPGERLVCASRISALRRGHLQRQLTDPALLALDEDYGISDERFYDKAAEFHALMQGHEPGHTVNQALELLGGLSKNSGSPPGGSNASGGTGYPMRQPGSSASPKALRPCDDAAILLEFATQAYQLTGLIDALHAIDDDTERKTLAYARDRVIQSAGTLRKQVGGLRDAVNRQGMLTGERKDALAKLSLSLEYIARVLESSLGRGWGYRIIKEAAPAEWVTEWNEHWHTLRHTTISMKHWAEGMADTSGRSVQAAEEAGKGTTTVKQMPAENKQKLDWEDVQQRLERLHDAGEVYTSQGALAGQIGCSQSTVQKAIQKSPKLKTWMARQRRASVSAGTLSDVVLDNVPQNTELDPAAGLTPGDVDIAMAKLIDEASPEERAILNAMNEDERQRIATQYCAQQDDLESSPLDDGEHKVVRQHKRA